MAVASAEHAERQWYIVGRWQEFEGEGRANLLRVAAVGAFYLVQLVHYHFFSGNGAAGHTRAEVVFHQQATAVAAAWTMVSVAILLCLQRRMFPAGLKYASSAADLVLLTALASLGDGPRSPLVLGYFLIIALAGLRFSLGLIWCCTLGSMAGYLLLVAIKDKGWFDADHFVSPVEQLSTLLSLGITGIVLGQVIRRVKGIAADYAQRMQPSEGLR